MRARIKSCTTSPVQEITLLMSGDFHFSAGQYLEIELPTGNSLALSIASAPHRLPELHLHYRSTPHDPEAEAFNELLASRDDLTVHGPFGSVCRETPLARPLLIVAGGTGGAQAMGLLDAFLQDAPLQPVTLLWCADSARDLYRRRWLQSLQAPWLAFECIVDPARTAANLGLQWLRDHAAGLTQHDVILSGSSGFVHTAAATLVAAGLDERQLASDMFDYSPV